MKRKELNNQTLVDTAWAGECLKAASRKRVAPQKAGGGAGLTRRWKVLAGGLILAIVGVGVSYQAAQLRPPELAGVKIPLAASLSLSPPPEKPPTQAAHQSEEDRRREAAAAARAQTRYAAEVRRLQR